MDVLWSTTVHRNYGIIAAVLLMNYGAAQIAELSFETKYKVAVRGIACARVPLAACAQLIGRQGVNVCEIEKHVSHFGYLMHGTYLWK